MSLSRRARRVPATIAFGVLCLVVSVAWAGPGTAHRLAAACCAYTGPPATPSAAGTAVAALRAVGGAFLLRHPLEAAWTAVALALLLAPFERAAGSARMVAVAGLGHVVPTVAVALSGLAGVQALGGGGLDVGASAVVAAVTAGLVVTRRSVLLGAGLATVQAIDALTDTPLAAAEHVAAVLTGALVAYLLTRRRTRGGPGTSAGGTGGRSRPSARRAARTTPGMDSNVSTAR
jgi:hypothetical protein